jgi:hypothetical protein
MLSDDDAITEREVLGALKVVGGLARTWRDPKNSHAIDTVSHLMARTFLSQRREPESPGDGVKQEVASTGTGADPARREYILIHPSFRI